VCTSVGGQDWRRLQGITQPTFIETKLHIGTPGWGSNPTDPASTLAESICRGSTVVSDLAPWPPWESKTARLTAAGLPHDHDLDSIRQMPPVLLPYLQAYWQLVTCRPRVGSYCGRPNHPANSQIPDDGYLDCPSPWENFPMVQQTVTQKPVAQDEQTSALSTANHGHVGHTPAHPRLNMSHTWKLELRSYWFGRPSSWELLHPNLTSPLTRPTAETSTGPRNLPTHFPVCYCGS